MYASMSSTNQSTCQSSMQSIHSINHILNHSINHSIFSGLWLTSPTGRDTAPHHMYAAMSFSYLGAMLASNHAYSQSSIHPLRQSINQSINQSIILCFHRTMADLTNRTGHCSPSHVRSDELNLTVTQPIKQSIIQSIK